MIQKLIVLVLILSGWSCGGNKTTPPQPETVQTIKAEVEQITQGSAELQKALTEAGQEIGDTTGHGLTPEQKKKQKAVQDLTGKSKHMEVHLSELKSVLDGLVADYAAGKITEEEFRKQYDAVKEETKEMSTSAQNYIKLLKGN